MVPVEIHVGDALSSGVEDGDDDGRGDALGPLLEVAAGDPAVHPLTANRKAAHASDRAKRLVARADGITCW
jgi:hypothetical protein